MLSPVISTNINPVLSSMFGDVSDTPPPPASATLDPPVLTVSSKEKHVYGLDRIVEGYTGNTVRVVRTSDNVEADFGFNTSTGIFNVASVISWAGGATVNVKTLYDQRGSLNVNVTGGTANLLTAGVAKRFGTTRNTTTDQLTRSNTLGGVGIDMGGNCYFTSGTATNFTATSGFEVSMLWSHNLRKVPSSFLPDGLGGDGSAEDLFMLDPTGAGFFRNRICGNSTTTDNVTLTTTNSTEGEAGSFVFKQYAQIIASYSVQPTQLILYRNGGVDIEDLNATVQSDIAGGNFNQSVVMIGSTTSANYPDILLGAFILSTPYTATERYYVHSKLNAIGQQHQIQTRAEIIDLFDEIIIMKDVSSGLAVGEKGNLTLDFDTPSNNWDYAYTEPISGLTGIRNPTKWSTVNGFKATTTWFAGTHTGSIFSAHIGEDHTSTSGGDLTQIISQATGNPYENESAELSLAIALDHNEYSVRTELASSVDTDAAVGTRRKADGTTFGANPYDGANQAMGKYNRSTCHTDFVYGETISGYVWTETTWKKEDMSAPYLLDAPVVKPCADNQKYSGKDKHLVYHFATFQKGANYNLTDSYATRKPYIFTGTTKSYLSDGRSPIGHRDGSIAVNPYASVVHSNANAYIMSHNQSSNVEIRPFFGTRFAVGFKSSLWTEDEMEKITINFYKLVA